MPEIQDYIKHIIQKHEKLPTNPPNPQMPEDMKFFGSKKKKKLMEKAKNGENVPSLAVVEAVVI